MDNKGRVSTPDGPMRGAGSAPTRDRWHFVPIVGWLRTYDRNWLRGDLIAGIAVAALIVPKNLGYAGIAGIPLQNGLYAAAAGAILYAVFGTSRQISTGPSSGLAAVAASAVVAASITGTGRGHLCGNDHPRFRSAVLASRRIQDGVDRTVPVASRRDRVPLRCGHRRGHRRAPQADWHKCPGSNPIQELRSWIGSLGDVSWPPWSSARSHSSSSSGSAIAPRIPGALVLVVGGLLASGLFDLGAHGVALVGDVPRGLPILRPRNSPAHRPCEHDRPRGGGVGAHRVLTDRRRFSGVCRQTPLSHRHQPGIGGSGNGERRRRSVPGDAGLHEPVGELPERPLRARTGLASLTSGVIVLLTLLVLAPLFSVLPKPVLAALIIEAVVMGMMDVPEMRRLQGAALRLLDRGRGHRRDAPIRRSCRGDDRDRALAAVADLGRHPPQCRCLGRQRGTQVFRELDEHPTDEQFPGVVVLRLDGGLFFATSDALEDRVREVALSTPGITGIVLDCEGIDFIDSQGSAKMREILELTGQAGVTLRLARVKPAVHELLDATASSTASARTGSTGTSIRPWRPRFL